MNNNRYKNFGIDNDSTIIIKHCREWFDTTPGGSFRKKPYKIENEVVTSKQYNNFVRSIPFFNSYVPGENGHIKGYCRAVYGYTYAGYIPVKITTISPWRDKKTIDTFTFELIREDIGK